MVVIPAKNLIVGEMVKCVYLWTVFVMARMTVEIGLMSPRTSAESMNVVRVLCKTPRKQPCVINNVSTFQLGINAHAKRDTNSLTTLLVKVSTYIHTRGKSLLELWVTTFLPD